MHTESRSSDAMKKVVHEKVDVLSGPLDVGVGSWDGGGTAAPDCLNLYHEPRFIFFFEVGNSGAVVVAQSVECAPQT